MDNYKLQVYKPYENGDCTGKYRFAVIDSTKSSGYPINFVCLLPKKIYDKPLSIFTKKFGENSLLCAVELLLEAIGKERDRTIKDALKKRLNALITCNKKIAKFKDNPEVLT